MGKFHCCTVFQRYAVNGTTTSLNVDDLIICRSAQSEATALSVSVHEFPAEAAAIFPERGAYCFWYRPRTEKGDTRVTVPELGLSGHRISRDHVLVFPPFLPVHGQWERAGWPGSVSRRISSRPLPMRWACPCGG
jgi:hypothetical protein